MPEKTLTANDMACVSAASQIVTSPDIIRRLISSEALSQGFDERGEVVIYYDRVEFLNQYRQVRLIEERAKNKNGEVNVHALVEAELEKMTQQYAQVMHPQPVPHVDNWREWKDYKNAIVFSTECAQRATRWGRFMIPGYIAKTIGYTSTEQMIELFKASEANQIDGFVKYVRFDPRLVRAIRNKDWKLFVEVFPSVMGEDQATRLKRLEAVMIGAK